MKYSDIFKSTFESLDHKWDECNLYLSVVCSDLEKLKLKEEWIDKQAFNTNDTNFSEFNDEEQLRKNIRNALTKYADLLFDFDQFYLFGDEDSGASIDPDDDYINLKMKVDHKYEMLKYFDSLCKYRDRVNRKKVMPIA